MLKGKTTLVTGASRGIGAAIAKKLASMGANVAIIYAGNAEKANNVAEECNAFGVISKTYCCDVANFEKVKETISLIKEDFQNIHILVNNAGVTKDGLMAMMKEEDFDKVLDTNLKGTFNMIRHCANFFIKNREGCIINISSVSGIMGNPGQVNYSASKAGIIGLTKSIAKELAPRGIRCNAIAPGFIKTDMTASQEESPLLNYIPLKRFGEVEDIADTVEYLVKAKYVTGEVIRVDGGIAM